MTDFGKSFLILAVLCTTHVLHAASFVQFNASCLKAQTKVYRLELGAAKSILNQASSSQPDNVIPDYLLTIHHLFKILVNESVTDFAAFHKQSDNTLKKLETCKNEDGYADFLREEIYFYNAVVHGKVGNNVAAANSIRMSYKYGKKVVNEHPDFLPAYKTIGLLHAGMGNLPSSYQKLISVLGYSGSTSKGIEELNKIVEPQNIRAEWKLIQQEAKLFLAAVEIYILNDAKKSWSRIDNLTGSERQNPLMAFVRANFADKCKKNDEVIQTLQSISRDPGFEPFPYLDFLLGSAQLQRLDPDASIPLLRYLTTYKGSLYVKSCYQKLAWNAAVRGDDKLYLQYMRKVLISGNTNLEEDQQAQLEAERKQVPNMHLLKSRLLFDGGYFREGIEVLKPFKTEDFITTETKTEYCYRKGRLYHMLKDYQLAEVFYKAAMITGANLPSYYASYSALFLAEIKEAQKKPTEARQYYIKATSFKNNKEYRNSIEHRAKGGLLRLK